MNPLLVRPDEDVFGGLLAGMTPKEAGDLAKPGVEYAGGLLDNIASSASSIAEKAPGSLGRAWHDSKVRSMAQEALDTASYYAGPHLSDRAAAIPAAAAAATENLFGNKDAREASAAFKEGRVGQGAKLLGLGSASALLDVPTLGTGSGAVRGLLRGLTKAAHYTPDLGMLAFHGSPRVDLKALEPSTRGPLGPGVYLSPNEGIAKRYAGETGKVYETDIPDTSLFHGIKSRDSAVNPYQVWRDQSAKLVEAAPAEHKAGVEALASRMDPSDGYPFFARLSQLLGGQDRAQELLRNAGYKGMTGTVDGPELVHFGTLPLSK